MSQKYLVGRISAESNAYSTILYSYDQLGRTTLRSVCTPSTCVSNQISDHYDLHYVYDLAGDTTFADRDLDAARNQATPNAGYYYGGLSMNYNNAAQLLSATADIVDGNHPASILSNLNYTPLGGVYTAELGSQYGQASYYDTRGRLKSRGSANLRGETVLADTWSYDAGSNVTQTNDSAQGVFNYMYDPLDRVTMGSTANESTNYGYDDWGNQTYHTVTAGSSYDWSFPPNLQNQATPPGVSYDAAGNMTSDGLHNYTYDGESRLLAVTDKSVEYDYDPEGMRVATVTSGVVTAEYLYDIASNLVTTVQNNAMLVRAILRANETHWGDYTSGTGSGGGDTEFRLVNQVGTLVANGDSNGNYVEGCLSGPYGDAQDCTPSYDYTETHFSDKLRDQETYNDYFGARYYNSTLGRFLSADDGSAQDPSNPQSWNLYSYVLNNPLSLIDPDGHEETCDQSSAPNQSACSGQGVAGQFQLDNMDNSFAGAPSTGTVIRVNVFEFSPIGTLSDLQHGGSISLQSPAPRLPSLTLPPSTVSIGPAPQGTKEEYCAGVAANSLGLNLIFYDTVSDISTYLDDKFSSAEGLESGQGQSGSGFPSVPGSSIASGAEKAGGFIVGSAIAKQGIRSAVKAAGGRMSVKAVGKKAAAFGETAGYAGIALTAVGVYDSYQQCMHR